MVRIVLPLSGRETAVLFVAQRSYTGFEGGEWMERHWERYVIGWCVTVLTAVLLRWVYARTGSVVFSVLTPIHAGAWEQGKLCFWPYLAGALFIWRLGDGKDSRGGHCALLVAMPLVMTALCAALGVTEMRVASALWLLVTAVGVALYGLLLRRHLWGGEVLWYTLAILLGIAYLLVTAMPPQGEIFMEPSALPTMAIPV